MTRVEKRAAGAIYEAQNLRNALRQQAMAHDWRIIIVVGERFYASMMKTLRDRGWEPEADEVARRWAFYGFPIKIDRSADMDSITVRAERDIP